MLLIIDVLLITFTTLHELMVRKMCLHRVAKQTIASLR